MFKSLFPYINALEADLAGDLNYDSYAIIPHVDELEGDLNHDSYAIIPHSDELEGGFKS